ncbi:LOW QUALITY PROTEIN: hypothetical protein HID58_091890 [Brassica napus]|uniref:Flotillin-like n=1 Tax=Brassica napus TaxID=3708 RepID=A0ABQ7WY65_BRANA|nr:LOW QUALITY PROTEIN: hypothetical protein HID58_091890 [Brassica napus]
MGRSSIILPSTWWYPRHQACQEVLGVSMAILHRLRRFSPVQLHVRGPGHEFREAPFCHPRRFHFIIRPSVLASMTLTLSCCTPCLCLSMISTRTTSTSLFQGVIEGETRVLVASRKHGRKSQGPTELNQFGLVIYNANVKQLVDVPGHEYFFSYLAQIDVAEAKMKGEVGAKERTGLTIQNAAKIDAESKIISHSEAREKGQRKRSRMRRRLLLLRLMQHLRFKSCFDQKLSCGAEVEACQGSARSKLGAIRQAKEEQKLFCTRSRSKPRRLKLQLMQPSMLNRKMLRDLSPWPMLKGLISRLFLVDNNYSAMRDFLMINNGIYQDIAKTNAMAIRDLQPKISVWNQGGAGDIAGLYKMLPPVLDTVYEQTGMQPPAWIGTLRVSIIEVVYIEYWLVDKTAMFFTVLRVVVGFILSSAWCHHRDGDLRS